MVAVDGRPSPIGCSSNGVIPPSSSSFSSPSSTASAMASSSSSSSRATRRSFKTVLLGDTSVGKSSLVLRFVHNSFTDHTGTTIGAAFFSHPLKVDGREVQFDIWDTAGQERFASLAPMYYRGASAAIVVYDQTLQTSFDRAQLWIHQLQLSGNPNIVIALAANKCDLPQRVVDPSEARGYADSNGLLFVETSARTGQNVVQLFSMLARKLPEVPFQATAVAATNALGEGSAPLKLSNTHNANQDGTAKLPFANACCAA
eukprot:GHVT01045170.1.p1 GENE.GHVT01045170.1~~GHVT01045170.1.p1  ORF type:complete len:259 (+),score=66.04 GHVT01045170.1:541-1317(+)